MQELESLVDDKTVAIIVNNPSNPCGSVYGREHLNEIISIADKFKLPIIADEVYGDMVSEDLINIYGKFYIFRVII